MKNETQGIGLMMVGAGLAGGGFHSGWQGPWSVQQAQGM